MDNVLNMLTSEEKEIVKMLCHDIKIYQNTESEAKREKEKAKDKLKTILDKYNYNGNEKIDIFSIDYKEQVKTVVDTEKLKACGLYDNFSKEQVSKPLTVR